MGDKPGHNEPADCVTDVMAMEVDPPERHVENPNRQSELSSWYLLKDEGLNQQYVDCEDASLSGVPTGP